MTHPLSLSQVPGTELYLIENMPQAVKVRPSGQMVYGYTEGMARRLVAAWNASLPYSLEELEAGVIAAEHNALEYAFEKDRLQQVLVDGCSLHPSYRAKQKPRPRIFCPACEEMWKASQALGQMTTKKPDFNAEVAARIISSGVGTTVQQATEALVGFGRAVADLVEEKMRKGADQDD